mgnify:CR=1 FL=1
MNEEKLNILMAVNQKYVPQMKTLICSIGVNCKQAVDIYLMHSELPESIIDKLSQFVAKWCKGNLIAIKLDKAFLKNAKLGNHFSVEMYYRIFASEYLPQNLKRILWLDADIVVLKNIETFYKCNMNGKSIVACKHREKDLDNPLINQEAIKRIGVDDDFIYFNSGVLLMDLQKIRNYFNHDKVCNLIAEYNEKLIYPDQDILNLIYQNDVFFADETIYNFQVHFDWSFRDEENHIENNVVILHFAGPVKPWKYNTKHFSYQYYWKYYLLHGKKSVYLKYLIMQKIYEVYRIMKKY